MEEPVNRRIAAVRLDCEREIEASRRSTELAVAAFRRSLPLARSRVEATRAEREDLRKIKEHLSVLEEDLEKALSVKANKEEQHRTIRDCISTAKARVEELEKLVQDQKIRRDEYAAIISQQLLVLEALDEKCNLDDNERENLEEAVSWYHRVLGFRVVGGDGVKFYFNKIDGKNPEKEFSFTIRLVDDKYSLVQCDPLLQDTSKLVEELNHTNGLYEFVRIMRGKFQASIPNESYPVKKDACLDISMTTISSPPPVSVDSRLESVTGELYAESEQSTKGRSRTSRRVNHLASSRVKSPAPLPPLRQSPRFLR